MNYFWCYIPDGDWDYCSPPYALDGLLYRIIPRYYDAKDVVSCASSGVSGNDVWPTQPFLYAVRPETGPTFKTFASDQRHKMPLRRISVPFHFSEDSRDEYSSFKSPWVETWTDPAMLDCLTREWVTYKQRAMDLVKIDTRFLNSDNRIVDLTQSGVRKLFLGTGGAVTGIEDYTNRILISSIADYTNWVLISWDVPSKALVSTKRYMILENGELTTEEILNSGYGGKDTSEAKLELFEEDDQELESSDVVYKVRIFSQYSSALYKEPIFSD